MQRTAHQGPCLWWVGARMAFCLAVAMITATAGCGNRKQFAGRGDAAIPPNAADQGPESDLNKTLPQGGYTAPEIKGSGTQIVGTDGSLPPPVDPDENPEVTVIEEGDPTKIGLVKSPRFSGSIPLTCPLGVLFDSTCLQFSNVYAWRPAGDSDDAHLMLSARSEPCTEASNAICTYLQSKTASQGVRSFGVMFRSLAPSMVTLPELTPFIEKLHICHGPQNTLGLEVIVIGQSPQCPAATEVLWGFRAGQAGTVPLFLWNKSGSDVLSLSSTTPPAAGFALKMQAPVLHVLPPAP